MPSFMETRSMTRADKIKEALRLNKNVSRRISRIRNLGDVPGSQYAAEAYERLNTMLTKYNVDNFNRTGLSHLSDSRLDTVLAQLTYIDRLKTSRVKGVESFKSSIQPFLDGYNKLSRADRSKVNSILSRLYEYAPWVEQFKYGLKQDIVDAMGDPANSADPDTLMRKLLAKYEEEKYGSSMPGGHTPLLGLPSLSSDDWDEYEGDDWF